MSKQVRFHYADRALNLANKRKIQSFVASLFYAEGVKLKALNYVFCSDDYLLDINQKFLQHDYYTDIITFDLTEDRNEGVIGELYISVDRVKEQANGSFEDEMLRVIFHGALHLCGFNDKLSSEIKQMRNKEDLYLRLYYQQNP